MDISFAPQIGPDGIPTESSAIAYTEKVLEEKESELKKYIQDNYSKIRNVERELASLALEIKLTSGPKKAALEHLRKKIELSAEKIKVAKQKEEQARKVWEATTKALKEEEENKQRLCEDLNRLVQESAASQYSRLEGLKKRLEALNPETTSSAAQHINLQNGSETSVTLLKTEGSLQETLPDVGNEKQSMINLEKFDVTDPARATKPFPGREDQKILSKDLAPSESRSRSSPFRPGNHARGRGGLVKGVQGHRSKANTWTGAGFDVDDGATNG